MGADDLNPALDVTATTSSDCASEGQDTHMPRELAVLAEVFDELRAPVYRYVLVIVGNSAVAEEITQEVFLQLCRSFKSGRPISNLRGWVFRVARNIAIRQQSDALVTLDQPEWDKLCAVRRDSRLSPEELLLDQERARRVHQALALLSPREKECLHLRAEGFRYREIAKILNIGLSTVDEFIHRAMQKLVREIND